jgi:hypothetical protein
MKLWMKAAIDSTTTANQCLAAPVRYTATASRVSPHGVYACILRPSSVELVAASGRLAVSAPQALVCLHLVESQVRALLGQSQGFCHRWVCNQEASQLVQEEFHHRWVCTQEAFQLVQEEHPQPSCAMWEMQSLQRGLATVASIEHLSNP